MRAALVVFVVILSASPAWSADKTDVVTLGNGDRITGEITSLGRGQLTFKTDDAGTLKIEWTKIRQIKAAGQFDVTTSDGRRFLGSLDGMVDGFVQVVGATDTTSLAIVEITDIAPIGASFWKRLDGSFDAGFSYTRSSGVAQTTLNSDAKYRRPAFSTDLMASATVTAKTDEPNDTRGIVQFSYERYRGPRWFVAGRGGVETNESLGITLRSQVAGLFGQRLVNSNRAQLGVSGGLAANNEQGVDSPTTQNLEGILALGWSYFTYDRPKTNVDVAFSYYPSLSHWGRQRMQLDTSLKREVWKDFFIGLIGFDTFDSDPPNPDASHNDVGVTASIGWSFGR